MEALGWTLIRTSEYVLRREMLEHELKMAIAARDQAREYAEKCERLVDHERERIDSERERADRIADSLFQSQGLPATSPTVLSEQRKADEQAKANVTAYQKQLEEIFGETYDDITEEGADDILKEAAAKSS